MLRRYLVSSHRGFSFVEDRFMESKQPTERLSTCVEGITSPSIGNYYKYRKKKMNRRFFSSVFFGLNKYYICASIEATSIRYLAKSVAFSSSFLFFFFASSDRDWILPNPINLHCLFYSIFLLSSCYFSFLRLRVATFLGSIWLWDDNVSSISLSSRCIGLFNHA